MHIKTQRLFTPGPTPFYPKALHAMLDADPHHRTEDFRSLYGTVLSDSQNVLVGMGAMEASVSNCLPRGGRVDAATVQRVYAECAIAKKETVRA